MLSQRNRQNRHDNVIKGRIFMIITPTGIVKSHSSVTANIQARFYRKQWLWTQFQTKKYILNDISIQSNYQIQVQSSSENNWLFLFHGTKSLLNICPAVWLKGPLCSKKPHWWTNDYLLNATGQIVPITMIPVFSHCHALVSTNLVWWCVLNSAHLVLRISLNMACGGI